MKLTAQNLREILDIAKVEVKDYHFDSFGYDVGNYHFYIWCDDSFGENELWWIIEPNKLEDGAAEPCGEVEEVRYQDYAQLLVACASLAERYFKEE